MVRTWRRATGSSWPLTARCALRLPCVQVCSVPCAAGSSSLGVGPPVSWGPRDREGEAGLEDRSSRPRHTPGQTDDATVAKILHERVTRRCGQDWPGPEPGVPARTVSRVHRHHDVPRLCDCDPLTREVISASKTAAVRYGRDCPGPTWSTSTSRGSGASPTAGSRSSIVGSPAWNAKVDRPGNERLHRGCIDAPDHPSVDAGRGA